MNQRLELETERLLLRPWKEGDNADLVEGLNNLEVSKWLAFVPHPYTKSDGESWLKHCQGLLGTNQNSYEFAVVLRAENKVIGGVSLSRISKLHGTAGGGLWLNPKYQGSGYGSEAFQEKIRFAFEDLGLRRLENGYFEGNEASKKMQMNIGFKIEGKKREAFRCPADGELKDEYITGLLIEEWKKL